MTRVKEKIFGSDEMLARAQFMVLLHRMEGEPEAVFTSVSHWPDVTEDWYENAVCSCRENYYWKR